MSSRCRGAGSGGWTPRWSSPSRTECPTPGRSRAPVRHGGVRPGQRQAVDRREVITEAPFARDKANLLDAIAAPLGCRLVSRTGRPGFREVFGTPADLERVDVLFTSLLVQQALGLAVVSVPWDEHPAAYRRSWMAGFANAVYHRLSAAELSAREAREAREASEAQAGPSVALVLATKKQKVDAAVEAVHPKLRKTGVRRLSGSGGRSGYQAGQRADLGGPRLAAQHRKAVAS